jgi:hypothetical protein
MLPQEHEALIAGCCEDVKAELEGLSPNHEGHPVVGVWPSIPITPELIETAVRSSIDMLVKIAGSTVSAGAIAFKPGVRKVVSQSALVFIDSIVHGWMDAKAG